MRLRMSLVRILSYSPNPTRRNSPLKNSWSMLFVRKQIPSSPKTPKFGMRKHVSTSHDANRLCPCWHVQENDNLRDEYITLFSDVQKDIPFARIALEKDPDAVNLWIGNSKSVTALHKDNYENIYVQVLGRKHFTIFPPLCHPCVNEQPLRPATYARGPNGLHLEMDACNESVPFATWDPDSPDKNATSFSGLAQPVRATLNPGDMLYLPAMW